MGRTPWLIESSWPSRLAKTNVIPGAFRCGPFYFRTIFRLQDRPAPLTGPHESSLVSLSRVGLHGL